jgi:hypothetical protein
MTFVPRWAGAAGMRVRNPDHVRFGVAHPLTLGSSTAALWIKMSMCPSGGDLVNRAPDFAEQCLVSLRLGG